MNTQWEKYKDFLIDKMPKYAAKLNVPAEKYDFEFLEESLNITLPKDFKEIYSINNGESGYYDFKHKYSQKNNYGILCGSKMLCIAEINDFFDFGECKGWIPIFKDEENERGFYIVIDVNPSNIETFGQVSLYKKYSEERNLVIAPSLTVFFERINYLIQEHYFIYKLDYIFENHWYDTLADYSHFEQAVDRLAKYVQSCNPD